MPTCAEIIIEARTWKGTPWQHQGRLKGIGVDCIGIVTETGKTTGAMEPTFNITGYGREPKPLEMRRALRFYFDPVSKKEMRPADMPWMRGGKHGQHVGFYTEIGTLIHAPVGGIVEELPLDEAWRLKIIEVYRFRGITV
jgi:cell wall-associated NlpC family hydrolase